jgi:pimeloyl-ACP methyl ester carboxylesterase
MEWSDGMKSRYWIFLRGLTRGNIHWGQLPELINQKFPEVQMEFLEIPGNGLLSNETSLTSPLEVVNYLRNKSQFIKLGLPVQLCGISLGGMVALKWAELYPENLKSVFAINTSLSQFSPFYDRLKPNNYFSLIQALIQSNKYKQEEAILRMTSNFYDQNKNYIKVFGDFAKNHQTTKANFIRQLRLATNIKIEKEIIVPVHILISTNDRLVNANCSSKIALNLNAKTCEHPTAGHDLPLDDPKWLIETLFLNS